MKLKLQLLPIYTSTRSGNCICTTIPTSTLPPPHASSYAHADATAHGPPHLIHLLVVLEGAQSLVVPLDLVPQDGVLLRRPPLVVLETAHTVQSLQVHPATEQHAHSVHDEVRLEVDLRGKRERQAQERIKEMVSYCCSGWW